MKNQTFIQIIVSTILLTILGVLANLLFPFDRPQPFCSLSIVSNLLISTVMVHYVHYYSLKKHLSLSLFIIFYGIGYFNLLIEAYIFDVTMRQETLIELARGLLIVGIYIPLLTKYITAPSPKSSISFDSKPWYNWVGKFVLADIIYLFFYLLAGFILVTVYPKMMTFYEDKIPPMSLIIQTQLFLRGILFALFSLLILRTTKFSKWHGAIFTATTFVILGGIAPLLPHSIFMPGFVRFGHGIEVTISNFAVGIVLSLLFYNGKTVAE